MRFPTVPSHILTFSAVFCLGVFPSVTAAQSKCNNDTEVGKGYKNSYSRVSKVKGTDSCASVTQSIHSCCTDNAIAVTCGQKLEPMVASGDWSKENPMLAGGDETLDPKCTPTIGGAKAPAECTKTISLGAFRSGARSSGVCMSLSERCDKACTSAADKYNCKMAKDFSDYSCQQANAKYAEWAKNDPADYTQKPPGQQTPPGSSPNPNANNGGGSGTGSGGTPTQKGSGGGGNPMSALAGLAGPLMQAMMAQQQQQPQQQPTQTTPFTPETCEQRPTMAHCTPKATDEEWKKAGTVGTEGETEKDNSPSEFNVGNSDATAPGYTGNGGEPKFGTPAGNAAVPNGGGQMPMGAGGNGAQAAGNTTGSFGIASKAATDILHGMNSGGGYAATNAGMQMQNGASGGGFGGYGQTGTPPIKPGMDLRQFLPGGKNDPTRKIAGGAASFQIQPQTVNIWSRISERFRARCTQGLLRDCNN